MKKNTVYTWGLAALIRAVKTMAQTAIGVIGASWAFTQVNWYEVGSAVLLAGILSVLMSLNGLPEVGVAIGAHEEGAADEEAGRNE